MKCEKMNFESVDFLKDEYIKTQFQRACTLVKDKELQLGRTLKVHIVTFGCQQNEADSERLSGFAQSIGYEKTADVKNADLVIFNTCAVREHAELKALSKTGQLKKLKEQNPNLIIGLWGCMVSQSGRISDIKNSYPYVDFCGATDMLYKFYEIIANCLEGKKRAFYENGDTYHMTENTPVDRLKKFGALVSIMYGCNNFCTYCIVPYVRGRERSRKASDVINEVKDLLSKGYKEITLLGQNVNSYNPPEENGQKYNFARLLKEIATLDGDFTVRFMTSHPKDVSDELIKVISENEKIERHFHLPLQSGSDDILKKMNRHYTREKYLETVKKLKENVKGITLTTDIIVGFPGETDDDFEKTLEVVKEVKFDGVFSFIYSKRPGTPAEKMEMAFTDEQISDRFSRLLTLNRENVLENNEKLVGKTLKVLCDSKSDEDGYFVGRDSGFKLCKFKAQSDDIIGKFVKVKIEKAGESALLGSLV